LAADMSRINADHKTDTICWRFTNICGQINSNYRKKNLQKFFQLESLP
jgi:hypothetical protein